MYAIADGRTIRVSADLTEALSGIAHGYRVNLHDLPGWIFEVAAPSADAAQAAAFNVARSEGRARSDAATIQRLSGCSSFCAAGETCSVSESGRCIA